MEYNEIQNIVDKIIEEKRTRISEKQIKSVYLIYLFSTPHQLPLEQADFLSEQKKKPVNISFRKIELLPSFP